MPAGRPVTINWPAVEQRYRGSTDTLETIAGEFGISVSSICHQAKIENWQRDLSARVENRTLELLRELTESGAAKQQTAKREELAAEYVEDTARFHARLSSRQLSRIQELMCIYDKFREELAVSDKQSPGAPGAITMTDTGIEISAGYSLAKRVGLLGKMALTLERIVDLERRVCGMEPTQKPGARSSTTNVQVVVFPNGGPGCGYSESVNAPIDSGVLSPDDDGAAGIHPEPV